MRGLASRDHTSPRDWSRFHDDIILHRQDKEFYHANSSARQAALIGASPLILSVLTASDDTISFFSVTASSSDEIGK